MPNKVGFIVPNQFVSIGSVTKDGRVLPSRELLAFLNAVVNRTGGDSPTVDLIVPPADILAPVNAASAGTEVFANEPLMVVSMSQLQDIVREAIALEMSMGMVKIPDEPMAFEMTMGVSNG